MAALGWLLNLDFAASDASIQTSFPNGTKFAQRVGEAKPPRGHGYTLRYIWGALCWMT